MSKDRVIDWYLYLLLCTNNYRLICIILLLYYVLTCNILYCAYNITKPSLSLMSFNIISSLTIYNTLQLWIVGFNRWFPFVAAKVVVEFDYDASQPDELTIKKGDIISDVKKQPGGWWEGSLNGTRGVFPDNFVKVLMFVCVAERCRVGCL